MEEKERWVPIKNKPHKHSFIIKEWADGARLQRKHVNDPKWEDYTSLDTPDFNSDEYEWRVKKENVVFEKDFYIYPEDNGVFMLTASQFSKPNVRFVFEPYSRKLIKVQMINIDDDE